MQQSSGQSLAEYGIILSLVAIAGIGGLALFGGSILDGLRGMGPEQTATASAVSQGADPPGLNSTASTAVQSQPPSEATGQTGNITLSNGKVVSFNSITDMVTSVTTAGANGTTTQLAGSLESLAQALLSAGEITEAEASGLKDLANIGHRMAGMQKVIEESLSLAETGNEFYTMDVAWEGKTIAMSSLSGQMDFEQVTGDWRVDISNPDSLPGAGPEMQKFLKTYQQIESSGLMQDPAVFAQVNDLAAKIVSLAETTEHAVSITDTKNTSPTGISDIIVSKTTDIYSAEICTTGGNRDSGQKCGV